MKRKRKIRKQEASTCRLSHQLNIKREKKKKKKKRWNTKIAELKRKQDSSGFKGKGLDR